MHYSLLSNIIGNNNKCLITKIPLQKPANNVYFLLQADVAQR